MATPKASIRGILELLQDAGLAPACQIDTDVHPGPLTLEGYKTARSGMVAIGASDTDVAVSFTSAKLVGIMLVATDPTSPFSWRAAAAETLWADTVMTVVWGAPTTMAADGPIHPGVSVLLSGNGTSESVVWYQTIEKV